MDKKMDTNVGNFRFGILKVSDRCHQGVTKDTCGPDLKALVEDRKGFIATVEVLRVVPDERDQIERALMEWSDDLMLDVILTTGGTGFSARDVTPEVHICISLFVLARMPMF
ncbi:gephyrin-like [Apostichopus japonicus]|uniref:gephyrin-like n=1 Tax=Stichopus japonicus TaxID=307972 RepID=UPI003AB34292